MKENSKVTDTNVGDIEENIEELKRLLYRDELTQYGKRKLINYYEQQEKDYKRVLKENEELKEDRKNNNVMISLAQNELLNYMSGYEDGKKHKMTAVAQVVENQQYYIIRKQMEKYEEHIKRLQKENEELKKSKITYEAVRDIQEKNRNIVDNNYISKQIVKDNLIKYQEEYELLLEHQSGKESNKTKTLRGRIHMCQELLEGRK